MLNRPDQPLRPGSRTGRLVQHTQVEFLFDVVRVAAGRYRSEAYHDFKID